jgi:pSer/pThr/pTyr-binding forkhead associated (FHA) protein
VFRDAAGEQRTFVFETGSQSATVGRHPSSDLLLDWDDRVSRVHARFERADDGWYVVDDGLSSNGTFVNEERLHGRHRMADGDIVRFGGTEVAFRSPPPQQSRPEQPKPEQPEPARRRPEPPKPEPARAPRAPAAVSLSTNQRRVLVALCRPCRSGGAPASDEQIAEELVLAVTEVRGHLRVLAAKLGINGSDPAQTRARLAEQAFLAGLVTNEDR